MKLGFKSKKPGHSISILGHRFPCASGVAKSTPLQNGPGPRIAPRLDAMGKVQCHVLIRVISAQTFHLQRLLKCEIQFKSRNQKRIVALLRQLFHASMKYFEICPASNGIWSICRPPKPIAMAYQQLGLKMLNKSPNPLGSSSFSLLTWPYLHPIWQTHPQLGASSSALKAQCRLSEALLAPAADNDAWQKGSCTT